MKHILFVGDNRSRENWGCRATSLALGEMLCNVSEVCHSISSQEVFEDSRTALPWAPYRPRNPLHLIDRFQFNIVKQFSSKLKSTVKANEDFLLEDPEESVERFERLIPHYPHLRQIDRAVADCDCVVVNGEGTLIFTSPARRDHLFYNFVIALASQRNKTVVLANAMVSDCPRAGRNQNLFKITKDVLARCDGIMVRDPESKTLLADMGLMASYVPDALFTWQDKIQLHSPSALGESTLYEPFGDETYVKDARLRLDEPYICISGSSAAAWSKAQAVECYANLAQELSRLNIPLLVVPTCTGDVFLRDVARRLSLPILSVRTPIRVGAVILARAAAFVSGRFHPSILASLGGTPCVFLGSNSHKTRSLQTMLEYDSLVEHPALPSEIDCKEIVENAQLCLAQGQTLRDAIAKSVARRATEANRLKDKLTSIHDISKADDKLVSHDYPNRLEGGIRP